jgi:hypothetical protein
MASRKNRSRRNRSRKNRNSRRRASYRRAMYGGACGLGGAAYGTDLMASSGAQSLAQGRQFAEYTRPYHGGSRRMRGGMAPLSQFGADGAGVLRAEAHLGGQDAALREAAAYSATHPDLPAGNFINDASTAVAKGAVNPMAGGRRRRGRKASRKARKSRKARRHGRKRSMRRGRKMRGGAIYEGAPYSQSSSDMLLADDAALQAQAAKLESPTWVGVERGTYL